MPSSQTLSALQEKGFRTTFRGFDKNDVLAYLKALDNENRQRSAEQEEQIHAIFQHVLSYRFLFHSNLYKKHYFFVVYHNFKNKSNKSFNNYKYMYN